MSAPATRPRRTLDALARDQRIGDPIVILRALTGLRQLTSLYPEGHQIIRQTVETLHAALRPLLEAEPTVRVDVIRGDAHLNDVAYRLETRLSQGVIDEFLALGIDSVHFTRGVTKDELSKLGTLLAELRNHPPTAPVAPRLEALGIRHVSLGRLVVLDGRWRGNEWPDEPTRQLDPDYAESLARAEEMLDTFASGRTPSAGVVRSLLALLMSRVMRSHAAVEQILAVKEYENHTYCHSVNVAVLSLLIGRQVGLDDPALAVLAEGALLHDVGKMRIPIEILRKPGKLDLRERRIMERHPVIGAEMLTGTPALHPLSATLALEHHRHTNGGGYPDLGDARPHVLSEIVAVADVYEAVTGARSYRDPARPEEACLILARASGNQLNRTLVKAFVNAVTFFPVGTTVVTSRDEIGTVIRQTPGDPLHPVITLSDDQGLRPFPVEIDTSRRDAAGAYLRHIVRRLHPDRADARPEPVAVKR